MMKQQHPATPSGNPPKETAMIIDVRIKTIDRVLCSNIGLLQTGAMTRGLLSQNLLSHSRDLVEHIAVKILAYAKSQDLDSGPDTIPEALSFIKREQKHQFLTRFHEFLQESTSHYTPDDDGAERLMVKYYHFYLKIRDFMKTEFGMDILGNLDKFPADTDRSLDEYHRKIAEKIRGIPPGPEPKFTDRMYVYKIVPFSTGQKIYYEITLTPAYNTASKYDRFVCFSAMDIPSHYAVRVRLRSESINVYGRPMPVYILTGYKVSVRPCELNHYASIFGAGISIRSKDPEYDGMMSYLTRSGSSLLDIVKASQHEYFWIKQQMFRQSKAPLFEDILDRSRDIIINNRPGSNILSYLLHTLKNRVIKDQLSGWPASKLSMLYLKNGCIPFDTMPFASSPIKHNPEAGTLFGCIDPNGHECEFLARFITSNMRDNAKLYTSIKELEQYTDKIDDKITQFNNQVYFGHQDRKIEKFGKNLYVKGAFDDTRLIIEQLQKSASRGVPRYSEFIDRWLASAPNLDCSEKKDILRGMFSESLASLIYGAAGTGKTYTLNLLSQFFNSQTKLFLANTHPAVENLKRKITAENCKFSTIRKFLNSSSVNTEYRILVLDECSMISNKDMAELLQKTKYKLLVLAGDTYQIESIDFGNWFSLARYFLPKQAWNELKNPYRTKDKGLLELWEKVRNRDENLTEHIVRNHYSARLDDSIFRRESDDEIVLCLSYDGLYGINNINMFLQESNGNPEYRLGVRTFKAGDPVLFNESGRFAQVLYNNLKGTIVEIENDDIKQGLWFSIEVEKSLTNIQTFPPGLELLEEKTSGKSVVRFFVSEESDTDADRDRPDESDIPFQIAYAVSIHKAQGLEYDSVKVVITRDIEERITHNIFYTAITRARKHRKIYWSPESQEKIIRGFEVQNAKNDATIFSGQTKIKMNKYALALKNIQTSRKSVTK